MGKPQGYSPSPAVGRTSFWEKTAQLIAFGLLLVNLLLWFYTKKAADAAKSAADTAHDTLVNQQASFQIDQRPYLVLDGAPVLNQLSADVPIKANITIRNIGRTPALKIIWNADLVKFDAGPKTPKGFEQFRNFITSAFDHLNQKQSAAQKEVAENGVEQDLAPQAPLFSTNQNSLTLSPKEFPMLNSSAIALYYIGVVTYTDRFGGNYKTEFCDYFFGSDVKVWHVCDSHNTIK